MLLYQHGFWENRQDNYVECSSNVLTLVPNGYNDIKAIPHAGVKVYTMNMVCTAIKKVPWTQSLHNPARSYLSSLISHFLHTLCSSPLQGSSHALNTLYVSIAPGLGYNCLLNLPPDITFLWLKLPNLWHACLLSETDQL